VGSPEIERETVTPGPEEVKRTPPESGPKGPGVRFARAKGVGHAADTRWIKAKEMKDKNIKVIFMISKRDVSE
jgi:hypothetical protein